eukprot:IDg23925t1
MPRSGTRKAPACSGKRGNAQEDPEEERVRKLMMRALTADMIRDPNELRSERTNLEAPPFERRSLFSFQRTVCAKIERQIGRLQTMTSITIATTKKARPKKVEVALTTRAPTVPHRNLRMKKALAISVQPCTIKRRNRSPSLTWDGRLGTMGTHNLLKISTLRSVPLRVVRPASSASAPSACSGAELKRLGRFGMQFLKCHYQSDLCLHIAYAMTLCVFQVIDVRRDYCSAITAPSTSLETERTEIYSPKQSFWCYAVHFYRRAAQRGVLAERRSDLCFFFGCEQNAVPPYPVRLEIAHNTHSICPTYLLPMPGIQSSLSILYLPVVLDAHHGTILMMQKSFVYIHTPLARIPGARAHPATEDASARLLALGRAVRGAAHAAALTLLAARGATAAALGAAARPPALAEPSAPPVTAAAVAAAVALGAPAHLLIRALLLTTRPLAPAQLVGTNGGVCGPVIGPMYCLTLFSPSACPFADAVIDTSDTSRAPEAATAVANKAEDTTRTNADSDIAVHTRVFIAIATRSLLQRLENSGMRRCTFEKLYACGGFCRLSLQGCSGRWSADSQPRSDAGCRLICGEPPRSFMRECLCAPVRACAWRRHLAVSIHAIET